MNQDGPKPSFELPPPIVSVGEDSSVLHETVVPLPELAVTPQVTAVPKAAVPGAQLPNVPTASPIVPIAQPQPSLSSPVSADDNDLIEEEWVIKAKQIVATTRSDPHVQSRELNRFKADYLKKRYNKSIKLEES